MDSIAGYNPSAVPINSHLPSAMARVLQTEPSFLGDAIRLEASGKCLHFYFDCLDSVATVGKEEVMFGILDSASQVPPHFLHGKQNNSF